MIVGLVKTIIKAMDYGTPNARTIWTLQITRIDDMAFHVVELDRPSGKMSVIHGIDAAAKLIGHFALTSAFLVEQIPVLMDEIKLQAARIGVGAGWLPIGKRAVAAVDQTKVNVPSIDDRATKTLDESDRDYLLARLRKVEKAAIEGTISRKNLIDAIEGLEERIEKRFASEDYEMLQGAIEILMNVVGI
jgi:hypothetical protein